MEKEVAQETGERAALDLDALAWLVVMYRDPACEALRAMRPEIREQHAGKIEAAILELRRLRALVEPVQVAAREVRRLRREGYHDGEGRLDDATSVMQDAAAATIHGEP